MLRNGKVDYKLVKWLPLECNLVMNEYHVYEIVKLYAAIFYCNFMYELMSFHMYYEGRHYGKMFSFGWYFMVFCFGNLLVLFKIVSAIMGEWTLLMLSAKLITCGKLSANPITSWTGGAEPRKYNTASGYHKS